MRLGDVDSGPSLRIDARTASGIVASRVGALYASFEPGGGGSVSRSSGSSFTSRAELSPVMGSSDQLPLVALMT
ncbi:hypothetical protein AKJ09_08670 [Labilithrix luteola]|uniref:Uncharacterized protein n=1 Tax=Labilithrix luteola TaxID=1391654 RepID=A0A0K1Q8L1_9BACT|nr:hypothetical protein AKJ09_08670 [Labilithrix luteola]